MKIAYSPYTLHSDVTSRKGALLKIEFEENLVGYADCHPWPEFGDLPLEDQLKELQKHHVTPLMRCSLRFAHLDAEARKRKKSLLHTFPKSHYLITHFLSTKAEDIQDLVRQGYTHVKIKLGNHLPQEITHLLKLFTGNASLRLRLDFNEKLSIEEFKAFLKAIHSLIPQIDFIEDPIPFEPESWKKLQKNYSIKLACDRQAIVGMHWPESAFVLVVKPAIESIDLFEKVLDKVIVTTYLDHPLGQLAAAYVASQIDPKREKIHGLLTHKAYNSNLFSDCFSQKGPELLLPNGWGFGFDEQLSSQKWTNLDD